MSDTGTTPPTVPGATPWPPHRASAQKVRGRTRLLDVASFSRYRRRKLIRAIEAETKRKLLCYVSREKNIDRTDAFDLVRLLETIEPGMPISVLLDSPGGYVDAAEKVVHLLRKACAPSSGSTGDLEVVVPNAAKSAATLIALGADRILMSDSSELGAIDPQFEYAEDKWTPALAWIRAYEEAGRRCAEHPDNPAFAVALHAFDPIVAEKLRLAISRARACAESLLKRQGGNYTAAPAILIDVDRFPSHGQMIDWRTAKDIGIPQVHPVARNDPLWQQYWCLYRLLLPVCGTDGRVFESLDQTITVSGHGG